jgi:hypothetical protein
MLPPNLYALVLAFLCITAHETAGAARTPSSLRALIFSRAKKIQNRGGSRRENAASY